MYKNGHDTKKEEKPFDDSPLVQNIKYGDADLCSKRRKLNEILEQDDAESDENKTYLEFEANVNQSCFQSSFIDKANSVSEIDCKHIPEAVNDSLKTIKSNDFESSAKYNLTITDKPAVSSKGFDNTFKLLQNQIKINTEKTVDLFKTINADQKCSPSLRRVHVLPVREEQPTCFELQLEALERIQTCVKNIKELKAEESTSLPMLELLYKFLSKGVLEDSISAGCSSIQTGLLRKDTVFNRKLMYYVGKNISGSNCLKTVRNMLDKDEGTY